VDLLASYKDDKEVVFIRRRTKKQWYAESIEKVVNGDDDYLFNCPEEFRGKVVIE